MKRALAERAKQSLNAAVTSAKEQQHNERSSSHGASAPQHPPDGAMVVKVPTTAANPPPSATPSTTLANGNAPSSTEARIPRIEKPNQPPKSTSPQASPRPKKKQKGNPPPPQRRLSTTSLSKGSSVSQDGNNNNNEDEDSGGAFYLKHQNRALATELKSLQFAVQQLTEERDSRRQHCRSATKSVLDLASVWKRMEECALGSSVAFMDTTTLASGSSNSDDPPSTGTDESVEWTRTLQRALVSLGHDKSLMSLNEGREGSYTETLEDAAMRIAARAKVLQEWLGTVLKSGSIEGRNGDDDASANIQVLQVKLGDVTTQCTELEGQLLELAASRKDMSSRERRLRRNVYRMSAGMLSPEQVANTLERGEGDEVEAAVQLEKQKVKSEEEENEKPSQKKEDPSDGLVSSVLVDELNAKILNLKASVVSAEKSIEDLNVTLNEKESRITELSKRQRTDIETKKLESLEATLRQLKTSQLNESELESRLKRTETNWSLALGNEKAALAAVDELVTKFNKRWSEFTGQSISDADTAEACKESDVNSKVIAPAQGESPQVAQSREIATLQHKLDQALENVRQSETTRENLKVALSMNTSLQSKLDEVKSKYAQVQATRGSDSTKRPTSSSSHAASERPTSSSSHAASEAGATTTTSSSTKDRDSDQKSLSDRLEKYKTDYRKARKDLAAMQVSKDNAKSKYERAEKERESLADTNIRLLRQIGEKDDMNAKSLSTILHLKSLTEKLTSERDNLEQQAKSASQLALAARLATNAKERVSEEVVKEGKAMEARMQELEAKYRSTKDDLDRVSAEWSESSGKMTVNKSELTNALSRCDELVTENEQKREEIRKLVDAVNKSEREAHDAKEKLAMAMKSGIAVDTDDKSGGNFSVDQLKTQISVLKNRLACPVCHYRDKECIILRCRHMHCKQCVDERISTRSRKCPTCNIKFSDNDVGDIWLN